MQSGKSTFIKKLLKWRHLLFDENPGIVIYVYASRTPDIDEMLGKGLINKAVNHLPEEYQSFKKLLEPYVNEGILLVIDDGLSQLENYLPEVFEEYTSKHKTTVLFVSQATFLDSANFRRLSDNSHYIICTPNKRNFLKIRNLAMQARPCNHQFVINAYMDATKPKLSIEGVSYGYFILDFSVSSPEALAFKTSIFPNEYEPVTVYLEAD